MKDYKKILILRTDRMGDVVLTTPSFKVIRENYPRAHIAVLVITPMQELIEDNPHINEIIVYDPRGQHRGWPGFIRLIAQIRRKRFDLAVVFHTKKWTNFLCFTAGIPERLGYRNSKWGFLLNRPVNDLRHLGTRHESDYCLDLLESFGMKIHEKEFYVHINPAAQVWVRKELGAHNVAEHERVIAIHPGASDPSRRWPVHKYAELIQRLHERYPSRFILIGDKQIQDVVENIIALVRVPIINFTGRTSVAQFISLIQRAGLLISNDSGPVHVAMGLNTPVVSIFTRNQPGINPERWRPLGKKSRYISVPEDKTLSFVKAGEVDPQYLELIRTEQVIEAVDDIFKLC